MLTNDLITRETLRILSQETLFAKLYADLPPVGFWRGRWNLLKWRVRQAREWTGEIIAGRKFSDY